VHQEFQPLIMMVGSYGAFQYVTIAKRVPEASSRWRYVFYLNHIQNKIDAYLHGKRLRPDLAAAAPRKMKFLLGRGMNGALKREVVVE
jgi:hypothetical protein